MNVLKKGLIHSFSKMGYSITKKNGSKAFLPLQDYAEAIYSRKDIFFEIETDIACNLNQFFFSTNHWHYHTKMVQEIMKDMDVGYQGSILEQFYTRYQPRTICDFFFFAEPPVDLEQKDRLILQEDIDKHIQKSPWSDVREPDPMGGIHEGGILRHHGIQSYGPVTRLKGELELQRLKHTYRSIMKYGFQPEQFDGYITGQLLKYKNQFRFLIIGGVHRTAVLSALKVDKIPVTFEPNWPRVIDYDDAANFPQVKQGVFSEQLAKQIVQTYFTDNGTAKAEKLGLLEV